MGTSDELSEGGMMRNRRLAGWMGEELGRRMTNRRMRIKRRREEGGRIMLRRRMNRRTWRRRRRRTRTSIIARSILKTCHMSLRRVLEASGGGGVFGVSWWSREALGRLGDLMGLLGAAHQALGTSLGFLEPGALRHYKIWGALLGV